MTLKEIKDKVDNGVDVFWSSLLYKVIKSDDEYLIKCTSNGHCISLTWSDGVTLNGEPEDFFTL